MNEIDLIEKDSLQKIPSFKAGDTVSVYYKIKEVLLKAIKEGGTSIQDHKKVSGEIGYFQNYLSVYNREKEKCYNNCKEQIVRFKQNGRSTYYCPKCQK